MKREDGAGHYVAGEEDRGGRVRLHAKQREKERLISSAIRGKRDSVQTRESIGK